MQRPLRDHRKSKVEGIQYGCCVCSGMMVNIVLLTIRNKKRRSIEYSNTVNVTMSGAAARTRFLKNNVGVNR